MRGILGSLTRAPPISGSSYSSLIRSTLMRHCFLRPHAQSFAALEMLASDLPGMGKTHAVLAAVSVRPGMLYRHVLIDETTDADALIAQLRPPSEAIAGHATAFHFDIGPVIAATRLDDLLFAWLVTGALTSSSGEVGGGEHSLCERSLRPSAPTAACSLMLPKLGL